MAAAEARAGWQRTANRCFIQEDTIKLPKISHATSSGVGPVEEENCPNFPSTAYNPHNRIRDPPSDTKWWLHLQPNFEHHGDFLYEQLNSLEAEFEAISSGYSDQFSKISRTYEPTTESIESFSDRSYKVSAAYLKNEKDFKIPELKVAYENNFEKTAKNTEMGEFENKWIGAEKNEPWWRTADKDDLASLVAKKSLDHIENCDLPRPQIKHVRRDPSASLEYFGHDGNINSSLNRNIEMGCSSLTNCMHGSSTSGSVNDKHCILGDLERSPHGSEKPNSDSENRPSKAQLLEALCHSQTRAREAEKAAQEAYTEKEHIIKLVFKQASQLFAYKQWFYLLQLENFVLQLKNKNLSPIFPVTLPWVPTKDGPLKKGSVKGAKRKGDPPRYGFCRSAVAFAIGLGLAGAGLLLGWTMGWLFPIF